MFIVEGRTLGVFAALGVVLSMAVLDHLSDAADSTETGPLPVFTTALATPFSALRHESELALLNRSVASTRPIEAVAVGENLKRYPLGLPQLLVGAHDAAGGYDSALLFRDRDEHEAGAECQATDPFGHTALLRSSAVHRNLFEDHDGVSLPYPARGCAEGLALRWAQSRVDPRRSGATRIPPKAGS